jgi:CHAT domain-containing protein
LWKTRSFVADRFVRAFHSHLRQAPRNQALQRAQLEFLKRGELLVDWAGWQLYGETGALKFC